MATWDDLSAEALRAAKALLNEECYRGCVSRAYYSVYCAAAGRVVGKGVKFRHGWKNPAHEQLPGLIRSRFARVSEANRRQLFRRLRRLRLARTDADYRPQAKVDRALARDAIREACYSLAIMERLL